MIPCLSNSSLHLLVGTADERYAYSPRYFQATHFPQIMHHYTGDHLQKWTEDDLLQDLLKAPFRNNRIYAVLGSTGSGKSELLCWLKDSWESEHQNRPVIRISRTELNPQLLIRKCCEQLGYDLDTPLDESRWDTFLQKPITLVNQMVWSALSELLQHDEDIVPAAMLFRPALEQNLTQFASQLKKGDVQSPPELLSECQYQTLLESTSLPLSVEYQTFRRILVQKFDQFLFHGQDMTTWMKRLSSHLMKENIRPLLLIDDLVQSVNLYASELLDLFLTLEEGNWDIVIGLTPGVVQDSDKGLGLVQRFLTLDTIDDRVTKLWLSDEAGQSFYSLQQNEAAHFLRGYLSELKKANGYNCSFECPHAGICASFHEPTVKDDLSLLPLNTHLVNRLYEGVPIGKGKLRYLILHVRETIRFFLRGQDQTLNRVSDLLHRDCFAEHPDPLVKQLAEWFADPSRSEVSVPGPLLAHFGRIAQPIEVPIRRLHESFHLSRASLQPLQNELTHIRDWVEGKEVNRELLEPIRTGIAALIQDVTKATSLVRPFTPRQGASLQRTAMEQRVRYPIFFEASQKSTSTVNNILIHKDPSVFDIAGYQQLRPTDRSTVFINLAQDWSVAAWVYAGEDCQTEWRQRLEKGVGLSLSDFIFQLKEWSLRWKQIADRPWLSSIPSPFQENWMNKVEALYADWFLLRENMLDRTQLEQLKYDFEFDSWFDGFSIPPVLDEYHLHNQPFGSSLREHQENVRNYRTQVRNHIVMLREQLQCWLPILHALSVEREKQARLVISDKRLLLENLEIAVDLYSWCEENEIHSLYLKHLQRSEQVHLLSLLAADLGWGQLDYIDWKDRLDTDPRLRARVKTHIKALIQNGNSTLPHVQGLGIMTDLKTHCPVLFQALRVNLVTRV